MAVYRLGLGAALFPGGAMASGARRWGAAAEALAADTVAALARPLHRFTARLRSATNSAEALRPPASVG